MRKEIPADVATGGSRLVVASYSTPLQRACDQIFHNVALMHPPVVLGLERAESFRADGPTHRWAFDLLHLRVFPKTAAGPQPVRRSHSA